MSQAGAAAVYDGSVYEDRRPGFFINVTGAVHCRDPGNVSGAEIPKRPPCRVKGLSQCVGGDEQPTKGVWRCLDRILREPRHEHHQQRPGFCLIRRNKPKPCAASTADAPANGRRYSDRCLLVTSARPYLSADALRAVLISLAVTPLAFLANREIVLGGRKELCRAVPHDHHFGRHRCRYVASRDGAGFTSVIPIGLLRWSHFKAIWCSP